MSEAAAGENGRGEAAERAALAAAFRGLVLERGFESVSLAELCDRAGLSEAAFVHHYQSLEDCYMQTFEEDAERFDALVMGAYESQASWREGLRAAAYAAARFMEEEPEAVRFGVTAMFTAGERAQLVREAQLQRMVDLIDGGRGELEDPDSLGRSAAEAVFGSIYQAVVRELSNSTRPASAFVPELMYVAVRPYLGHAVAFEELTLPAPAGD